MALVVFEIAGAGEEGDTGSVAILWIKGTKQKGEKGGGGTALSTDDP